MTPREYLDEICRPSVDEFSRESTSIRRAWIAAAALHHFADCLAVNRFADHPELKPKEKLEFARKEIAKIFPQLQALTDIANASKHLELNRGPRKGLAAEHFRVGKGAAFSNGAYFIGGYSFVGIPDVIRVEFADEYIDVMWLCRSAIETFDKLA